jgi:autotransporter-associated beta strand protein
VIVNSTQNYTFSGTGAITDPVSGPATLTKSGSGTLTLSTNANNYSGGTTLSGGTLNLGSNVNFGTGGIGTGGVVFESGTLTHSYAAANTLLYSQSMSVAAGQTGTIITPNRFRLNGPVTGAGTLNMTIATAVSRADFQNSFSGFSGDLNLTGSGGVRVGLNALGTNQPLFDAAGWASTTLSVDGVTVTPTITSARTILIGALASTGTAGNLAGGTGGMATYSVGAKNLDTTYAGILSGGNAALTKTGSGTLTLSGGNTYTGVTTVTSGKLSVTGSLAATAVNVATTGTLGGTGPISGTVACNGTLAPGVTAGTLTLSAGLTLASTSALAFDLGAVSDRVGVTGNLTLDGTVNVTAAPGFTAGTYTLATYTGALTNNTLNVGTLPAGYNATVNTATAGQVRLIVTSTNSAPQVSVAAAASPSVVAGTTTALTVTATDNAGEGGLTYAWSATGPAEVGFSPNATNAAKNATATFAALGSYTLTVTVTDVAGLTAASSTMVTVVATTASLTVNPPSATLVVGGTQTLAATPQDQFGNPMVAPVSWSATGGGQINQSGVYTATAAGGPWQATASTGSLDTSAAITVISRTFEAWETATFTQQQINAGESAMTADPDQDGLSNLAEYALGTLPYTFTPQPPIVSDSTSMSVTFQRPAWIGDVIYHAEAGDNFTDWNALALEVLTPGTDPETVRATYTLPVPKPAMSFLRLRFEK